MIMSPTFSLSLFFELLVTLNLFGLIHCFSLILSLELSVQGGRAKKRSLRYRHKKQIVWLGFNQDVETCYVMQWVEVEINDIGRPRVGEVYTCSSQQWFAVDSGPCWLSVCLFHFVPPLTSLNFPQTLLSRLANHHSNKNHEFNLFVKYLITNKNQH